MDKIKYKHPVITEAVFELRFPNDASWGMNSFIQFAKLAEKKGFSEVVDAKNTSFEFNFTPAGDVLPKIIPSQGRIQTWNTEKTQLWQAGADIYAANRKSPYQGWNSFRKHIHDGFSLYCQVLKKRRAAERMAIHYLNRIEIDSSGSPEEYIEFLPTKIKFADKIAGFGCQTEQIFEDGDRIVVAAAREMEPTGTLPSNSNIILNISYVKESPDLEEGKFKELVEKAHLRIRTAFQMAVTSKQKERMEAI